MGSIFRVPVVEGDTPTVIDRLTENSVELVGTDPRDGNPFDESDLTGRVALVLGGESAGLSGELRERLSRTIRIPMRQGVESLSVTAAGAVLSFEIARQRRR
jgi:tRNA G18 (ribose-2'-O)-methylase SpoU